MAVRPIDANELYRIEKLLDTDVIRQDKVALNLLEQVLYDIQHVPTLTPPNEPLTLEQLREMDGEPVWVVPTGTHEKDEPMWCVLEGPMALIPGVDCWSWGFDGYGETWMAYRRPPEGET